MHKQRWAAQNFVRVFGFPQRRAGNINVSRTFNQSHIIYVKKFKTYEDLLIFYLLCNNMQ
jgi:hypothetical protein